MCIVASSGFTHELQIFGYLWSPSYTSALPYTQIYLPGYNMPRIIASVAQACTVKYDTQATLAKMERLATIAKEKDDSSLVVFPEAL